MDIKVWKLCFFLFLVTTLNAAQAASKILVSRYKNWSHPVEAVFEKYDLSLASVMIAKKFIMKDISFGMISYPCGNMFHLMPP